MSLSASGLLLLLYVLASFCVLLASFGIGSPQVNLFYLAWFFISLSLWLR